MPGERIYLDNAATSWPKPENVYAAVDDYQRRLGAPAGRSAYSEAAEVDRRIEGARRKVARLFGTAHPERLVFTTSGTDALNLALHGLLRPGDHVVTSVAEHNSILRPLADLAERGVAVSFVGCDSQGLIDPAEVRRAFTVRTRLVAVTHASNVTGAIQPVAEIAGAAHERDALMLVDSSQTAGHMPIDATGLGIDLLAAAGHKGLLGPLGTGVLLVRAGLERELLPIRQGGTGTFSHEDRQPTVMPSRYEAGNLNVPGILGLGAGVDYVVHKGWESIAAHERSLVEHLVDALREIPGVNVYGPADARQRAALVSITIDGYDPHEASAALEASHRVQVRSGLHCAPRMHQALGTAAGGGTIRFSVGPFNTLEHVSVAARAVAALASAALTA